MKTVMDEASDLCNAALKKIALEMQQLLDGYLVSKKAGWKAIYMTYQEMPEGHMPELDLYRWMRDKELEYILWNDPYTYRCFFVGEKLRGQVKAHRKSKLAQSEQNDIYIELVDRIALKFPQEEVLEKMAYEIFWKVFKAGR